MCFRGHSLQPLIHFCKAAVLLCVALGTAVQAEKSKKDNVHVLLFSPKALPSHPLGFLGDFNFLRSKWVCWMMPADQLWEQGPGAAQLHMGHTVSWVKIQFTVWCYSHNIPL